MDIRLGLGLYGISSRGLKQLLVWTQSLFFMQTASAASALMASTGSSPSGRIHPTRTPPDQVSTPMTTKNLARPVPTLTSSLDISVEGVLPITKPSIASSAIDEDYPPIQQPPPPEETQESTGKRAPRKSKTDALAALQTRSVSPFPGAGRETATSMGIDDPRPSVFDDSTSNPVPAPRALDMKTVKTKIPHDVTIAASRPFGLEDCPTFFPSVEEFADPLNYIRSISDRAQQYGICKVIPPDSWTMPFVTDTEVNKFPFHSISARN